MIICLSLYELSRISISTWAGIFVFFICSFGIRDLKAQEIDLLLKGGHVIDPKNRIDAKMDVAIANGKIVQVAQNIPVKNAKTVVDVNGLYVTPGLVDMHVHVFHGTEPSAYIADGHTSLPPDGFTFRSGVTTVVDAGSSGWRNFRLFKSQTIDRAQTRVLCFAEYCRHRYARPF
jgi:dihydroorotase